jgi:hypothetical protein
MNTWSFDMNDVELVVEHPRDFFARTEVLGGTYFNIAETEYCESLRIEKIDDENLNEEEKSNLHNRATEAALKAIVFSAMCVEASINNYAGAQLGDSYFKKHLASLDVISKWVVIPQLVCGKSIDKSSAAFASLKKLITARNNLVHNKSSEINASDPIALMNKLEKRDQNFEEDFKNSLKTLYLLSMEMDYVIGQRHNPMGTLNVKFRPFLEIPELAKPLFKTCKDTVLKKYS